MPFHQFGNIKLWLLEDLDLSDVAILDGENGAALLGDLVSDRSRNEFLDKRLEVSLGTEFGHVGDHLGTDRSALCGFGVTGGRNLVVLGSREGNAKETNGVSIRGTAIDIGLDDSLLFANQRAKLVAGHVHAVEIHETVVPLNILDTEADFAVGEGFILLEIGERYFNDASLQVIGGNLLSLGLGNQSLTAILDGKDRWRNQFVPFFLEKRIDGLFTGSLLGFR